MATVGVDSGTLYRRTHSLSHLAWSWVGEILVENRDFFKFPSALNAPVRGVSVRFLSASLYFSKRGAY